MSDKFNEERMYIDKDELITSGQDFNKEKRHLELVIIDINKRSSEIKKSRTYVNRYAVGFDYDDIEAKQYRKGWNMDRGVYKEEDDLRNPEVIGEPYNKRIDATCNGQVCAYYIGKHDCLKNLKHPVISQLNPFARQLLRHFERPKIEKKGKKYQVVLDRSFNIWDSKLHGFFDLMSDESDLKDIEQNIDDQMLLRVLRRRRADKDIRNILQTIQDAQNDIVESGWNKQIIVQGCAGSGKTMVLLHRLAVLNYENRVSVGNTIVLTPSENFNIQLDFLIRDLNLKNVNKASIEEYYKLLLRRYGVNSSERVLPEENIQKEYVDFVYSDEFLDKLHTSYEIVGSMVSEALNEYCGILKLMNRVDSYAPKLSDGDTAHDLVLQSGLLMQEVDSRTKALEDCSADYNSCLDRLRKSEKQLKRSSSEIERDALKYVSDVYLENRNRISETDIQAPSLDYSIENCLKWLQSLEDYKICNCEKEIVTIKEGISSIRRQRDAVKEKQEEFRRSEERLNSAKTNVDVFSNEVIKKIHHFNDRVKSFGFNYFFRTVFDHIQGVESKNKRRKGVYRYELYAMVNFARIFYAKNTGQESFICIDEGQDLAFNEYKLINEINYKRPIFNIYGDTAQLLKQDRGLDSWDRLRTYLGAGISTLSQNYRNTNQITRFCNENLSMKMYELGINGPEVEKMSKEKLAESLSYTLRNTNNKVSVIISRKQAKKNYIKKEKFSEPVVAEIERPFAERQISLLYVDETKGLEFENVIVDDSKMSSNEKYIAYTRATTKLSILV